MITRGVLFALLLIFTHNSGLCGDKRDKPRTPLAVAGDEILQSSGLRTSAYPSLYSGGPGDSICFTFYDFGTNGSPLRNLINYGDGTLMMGRMAAHDSLSLIRGAFCSCSIDGGASWEPCSGPINPTRTGWANVDQFVDAGGVAVIVEHIGIAHIEAARCANVWSTGGSCSYFWPRVAVGGGFTVHIIFSPTSPPSQLEYCKSSDAGSTWVPSIPICTTPGIFQDADAYDITARGSHVVIVCAGAGGDVALVRSTNAGETWTESIIYDIDETLLTPDQFVPDGSCAVILDGNDNPQVVWGTYYAPGDGQVYVSFDAGIMYWSEATGIDTIALPLEDSTICVPECRDGNYATGADIGVDDGGALYVIYSQVIPLEDSNSSCHEHIYSVGSLDGGFTWGQPVDITPGTGFDATFPSLADLVDNNLHLVYNCDPLPGCNDPFPGNAVRGAISPIAVAIMYLQVPATTVVGVSDDKADSPTSFVFEQNYPNPFNSKTAISFQLSAVSQTSLVIYDLLGRRVATLVNEKLTPGTYTREWDATGQASGVYFYRLSTTDFVQTKKLVLLR